MSGYCGKCNEYYDSYDEHLNTCIYEMSPEERAKDPIYREKYMTDMERFQYEADQQGIPEEEQERIWNEEYR